MPKTNVTDDEASAEEDKASDEAKGNNTEPARTCGMNCATFVQYIYIYVSYRPPQSNRV